MLLELLYAGAAVMEVAAWNQQVRFWVVLADDAPAVLVIRCRRARRRGSDADAGARADADEDAGAGMSTGSELVEPPRRDLTRAILACSVHARSWKAAA